MNRPQIEQWIEALESGNYQQTRGRLRRGDAFCCLGVACDISGRGLWDVSDRYAIEASRFGVSLPESLVALYDLTDDEESALIEMNDNDLKSFAEIAQYLRARLAQEEQKS